MRASTCARWRCRARRWPATTVWRTSRSRCRGSAPVPSRCSDRREQRREWLSAHRAGTAIAAFALTEAGIGIGRRRHHAPRPAATATAGCWTARRPGSRTAGSPTSTWSSPEPAKRPARKGLSAFIVPAATPGLTVVERLHAIAPHPLAPAALHGMPRARVGADWRAGRRLPHRHGHARRVPRDGRRGRARLRAARPRRGPGGVPLAPALRRRRWRELQMVQGHLADMALEVDTVGAAGIPCRVGEGHRRRPHHARGGHGEAARDRGRPARHRRQRPAPRRRRRPRPVHVVERLYREVRALRIYEGASDVQRVVIARAVLAGRRRRHEDAMSTHPSRLGPSAHVDTFARDRLPPADTVARPACSIARSSSIPSASMSASS